MSRSCVLILLWLTCSAQTGFSSCDAHARMVALGDLHGDLENALATLRLLRVVDEDGKWNGGRTILIQTGDLLDRGPNSIGLVKLFRRLQEEARDVGGEVILLLGNHELMNRQHIWDDVSREEVLKLGLESLKETRKSMRALQEGWRVWEDLMENGILAAHINDLPALAVVGTGKCRTVFSHAGLLSNHIEGGFTVEKYNNRTHEILTREDAENREGEDFSDADSPLWNRILSWGPLDIACKHLDHVLHQLEVHQMVVGHSVHKKISTRCGGRLHLIDIGISEVYGGRIGGWQCENDVVKAIYPNSELLLKAEPTKK